MQDDGEPQFPPQWMVRDDAEITADIGGDGAEPAQGLRTPRPPPTAGRSGLSGANKSAHHAS